MVNVAPLQNLTEYDPKKHFCRPHDGSKGLRFRQFCNDFLTAVATLDIKDPAEIYDYAEYLTGIDEGGPVAPPGAQNPIPLPAGAPAARRRLKRAKQSFAYIYQHITDERLRRMLVSECFQDGLSAWALLHRECNEPVTDLELETLKANVRGLTFMATVGHNAHSVSQFRQVLSDENAKIPTPNDQLSEHDLCLILLKNIARSSGIFEYAASKELRAGVADRVLVYPPNHPNLAGQRSLSAIVSHFDPLWKSAIHEGSIAARLPGGLHPPANRARHVDGFTASANGVPVNLGGDSMQSEKDGGASARSVKAVLLLMDDGTYEYRQNVDYDGREASDNKQPGDQVPEMATSCTVHSQANVADVATKAGELSLDDEYLSCY